MIRVMVSDTNTGNNADDSRTHAARGAGKSTFEVLPTPKRRRIFVSSEILGHVVYGSLNYAVL